MSDSNSDQSRINNYEPNENQLQIICKDRRHIGNLAWVEHEFYINMVEKEDYFYQKEDERRGINALLLSTTNHYFSSDKQARKLIVKLAEEREGFTYLWLSVDSETMEEDLTEARNEFVITLWDISNLKIKVPVDISLIIAKYWDDSKNLCLMKIQTGCYWGCGDESGMGLCMYHYVPIDFQVLLPMDEKNWTKQDWSHTFHKTRQTVNKYIDDEIKYRKQFEDEDEKNELIE